MKFLNRIFSLFLLLIIVISCKKENPQEDTDNLFKFKDYIYYTTSGVVSVTESLQIGLAKEVEGWEPDTEISEDLITISPAVKGKLKALNSRTFVFKPDENLKPDTEYTVTVNLSEMYLNLPSEFQEYTFKFKTIKPNFALNTNNLQSYSKEWQYIEGVLRSADVIPLEIVEKLVSVTQNGKPLSVKWLPVSQNSSVYQFKIDSIQRLKDDSEIDIKWSGKEVGIDNVGEVKRVIPGISNFSIVNADVIQSPEQHLALNFSDPIKKQQNFKGLVAIAGAQNLKYVVDGNVLKVYPGTRLKGNVQVDVFSGITNVYGFKFKKKFSEQIAFEELKPAVKLMSNGVILPDSKNLQLNFEAVNLKAVDIRVIKIFENNILQFLQEENLNGINSYSIRRVGRRVAKQTMTLIKSDIENDGKWKTYAVDLSKMIKADPGAIYRIELSFTQEYALNTCDGSQLVTNVETEDYDAYFEEDDYDDTNLAEDELEEREEQYWDNLIYNYKNHRYYNWEDRENPCKEAYYFNENNRIV